MSYLVCKTHSRSHALYLHLELQFTQNVNIGVYNFGLLQVILNRTKLHWHLLMPRRYEINQFFLVGTQRLFFERMFSQAGAA